MPAATGRGYWTLLRSSGTGGIRSGTADQASLPRTLPEPAAPLRLTCLASSMAVSAPEGPAQAASGEQCSFKSHTCAAGT